jgi:hypothetical protein
MNNVDMYLYLYSWEKICFSSFQMCELYVLKLKILILSKNEDYLFMDGVRLHIVKSKLFVAFRTKIF